jgi:hypothetical protein
MVHILKTILLNHMFKSTHILYRNVLGVGRIHSTPVRTLSASKGTEAVRRDGQQFQVGVEESVTQKDVSTRDTTTKGSDVKLPNLSPHNTPRDQETQRQDHLFLSKKHIL